jgi:hypothetical protein
VEPNFGFTFFKGKVEPNFGFTFFKCKVEPNFGFTFFKGKVEPNHPVKGLSIKVFYFLNMKFIICYLLHV